jgi:hypothetical protein
MYKHIFTLKDKSELVFASKFESISEEFNVQTREAILTDATYYGTYKIKVSEVIAWRVIEIEEPTPAIKESDERF